MGKTQVRHAEGGMQSFNGRSNRQTTRALKFRIPHSAFRIRFRFMPVQAIAWSPTGAVRIIDQRALPQPRIDPDLDSPAPEAELIRTLQVGGPPWTWTPRPMGLLPGTRERPPPP